MDVLSIGNSFSRDAQRYIHGIAEADEIKINCFNLYIGGCPLSRHFRNMLSEERAYQLDVNGTETGFRISMKEALLSRDWDVITVQEASPKSLYYEMYQPYLNELVAYIRKMCPKAKLCIHQTWAYEEGSEKLFKTTGYTHRKDMFRDLETAYQKAFEEIQPTGMIPSGALFELLAEKGANFHRDTYHASYGFGRYALGLLWYAFLTGRDIAKNSFTFFDEKISDEEICLAKDSVKAVIEKYSVLK